MLSRYIARGGRRSHHHHRDHAHGHDDSYSSHWYLCRTRIYFHSRPRSRCCLCCSSQTHRRAFHRAKGRQARRRSSRRRYQRSLARSRRCDQTYRHQRPHAPPFHPRRQPRRALFHPSHRHPRSRFAALQPPRRTSYRRYRRYSRCCWSECSAGCRRRTGDRDQYGSSRREAADGVQPCHQLRQQDQESFRARS